jgi:hypothetical protein
LIGVNDDNTGPAKQRCSSCYRDKSLRFAISLGMLLGMGHGWAASEGLNKGSFALINVVQTVKSDTRFAPFSSDTHTVFPY